MYEQPILPVKDPATFGEVKAAIEDAFAPAHAPAFLKRIDGARLRARDFEEVLDEGLLGVTAANAYRNLQDGDRGQIRELYLRAVEQVAPELRAKFLKVYAYY
jgi:hypothetical protein